MQVTNLTSRIISLPSNLPARLLTTLMSGVDNDGVGWIVMSFFEDEDFIAAGFQGERMYLTLRRDLMESLLGALGILLSANRQMRESLGGGVQGPAVQGCLDVEILAPHRMQPGVLKCSWPASELRITQIGRASCRERV